jgi:aryl-alcohol dehydrogenase-like predicted oxidoreductase
MEQRKLGQTSRDVSIVGLGCWQLSTDWGAEVMSDVEALAVLNGAVDAGVTFLDTADNYGDGVSEKRIGRLLAERGSAGLTVATKMGQRADPHVAEAYNLDNFRAWVDRSRRNLGVEVIDLVQLHCPPSSVLSDDRVYDALNQLVSEGCIGAYGVSVETCDEALAAIAHPGVASVQLILNIFRQKPLEQVVPAAAAAGVGIIARVPLASGMLSNKYNESTTFSPADHRNYNLHGEAFDIGETFSGVPYDLGLRAAREVAAMTPSGATTAQLALRWIVDQPGVTTVIPGARTAEQAISNAEAGSLPPLTDRLQMELRNIYDRDIRELVHSRW